MVRDGHNIKRRVINTLIIIVSAAVIIYLALGVKDRQTRFYRRTNNSPGWQTKQRYLVPSIAVLQTRFNKFARENKLNEEMRNLAVQKGEDYDSCVYEFRNKTKWIIKLNKDSGTVSTIMFIGNYNGTLASGVDNVLMMQAVIYTADTSLPEAKRNYLLDQLGMLGEYTTIDTSTSIDLNGIRYRESKHFDSPVHMGASVQ